MEKHFVNGTSIEPPFPGATERAVFGMGCFWGAERLFWVLPGVYTTAVGYAGGSVANPDYELVCSGRTGHAEVVLVVYDPAELGYEELLAVFWQGHDPTQGMRQGNDVGTQYRSLIQTHSEEQLRTAQQSRAVYQEAINNPPPVQGPPPDAGGICGTPFLQAEAENARRAGLSITTEIGPASEFYYAETYHQQYLARNPRGYCGLGGMGVNYPRDAR